MSKWHFRSISTALISHIFLKFLLKNTSDDKTDTNWYFFCPNKVKLLFNLNLYYYEHFSKSFKR